MHPAFSWHCSPALLWDRTLVHTLWLQSHDVTPLLPPRKMRSMLLDVWGTWRHSTDLVKTQIIQLSVVTVLPIKPVVKTERRGEAALLGEPGPQPSALLWCGLRTVAFVLFRSGRYCYGHSWLALLGVNKWTWACCSGHGDAEHVSKDGEFGWEWLWDWAVRHTRTCSWVTGPGSRKGRGLGMPHVSDFVGNELTCAKLHWAHFAYLWENHIDSSLKASRALLAFIPGNVKFHSNLWYTSPLPHYLKCGFTLKIACIKLASASLADIFHVWNQNISLLTSMARTFFTCSFFMLMIQRLSCTLTSQAAALFFPFDPKLLATWRTDALVPLKGKVVVRKVLLLMHLC